MRNPKVNFIWWAGAAVVSGLIAGGVGAQPPQPPPPPPAGTQPCNRPGFLHRMIHHSAHTLHDKFIGYPDLFIEPPLGSFVREQFTLQVAKADPHRATLYRSDFLPGTDRFSPVGASRFNRMYTWILASPDPVIVEWTPDQPGLAEARRGVVLATFQKAGKPIPPERVVIGPSPYPGAMGVEAANNFSTVVIRSQQAGVTYPPSPQPVASGYVAGVGGGGGPR